MWNGNKGDWMKILSIVGARPNFIKIAPLLKEMRKHRGIGSVLVHTGQHYDAGMAGQFFADLEIPTPDVSLGVGSGSHAHQTAEVMKRLEPVLLQEHPDVVVVVGDVNSTMAAAVTAVKLHIPVAHIEAGLRSFDRSMPEEINRLVTDAVSDFLFVTEESGRDNLRREGVNDDKIFFVGNVMIDSLEASRRLWKSSNVHESLGLTLGKYGVLTLHRPSNVDDPAILERLIGAIAQVAAHQSIIFPIHPRTRTRLEAMRHIQSALWFGSGQAPSSGILCVDPLGYLDFMALVSGANLVLTDSGGLQEETTVLGVPCLTLRENTERPVTTTHGTNRVIGCMPERIIEEAGRYLQEPFHAPLRPPLWDGHASERIISILFDRLSQSSPSATIPSVATSPVAR
jgi:UDP-N-acetylglucosamine 2-epimerase (non-hydrolysing)